MNNPIAASLNQNPETGQIGGGQNQMQNTQLHGFHGYVPPTFTHSHQNVINARGYVPYQEEDQVQSNNMIYGYNDHTPSAVQNNPTMMNPYPYSPYPVFHDPYALETSVQNHICQPQAIPEGFYNIYQSEPTQHAPNPNPPGPGIEEAFKSMKFYVPLAPELFAPPKNQISTSNEYVKRPLEAGAPQHPKTGSLHNGNSRKQKSITTIPKQANKYQCSSCKKIVEKIILKKKGPKNWLCEQCYHRDYHFGRNHKTFYDNKRRNAAAS